MSGDSELLNPTTETPPSVADAAPPLNPPVETPKKDDDEPEVVVLPTGENQEGDKWVQLSALTNARAKAQALRTELEAAKAEAGKSADREAQIAQLQQQLQQMTPLAQAYQAAVEAQARQPQKPAEPTPEQHAKLEKVAKLLDFYKSDGTLDLARAQTHQELIEEAASEIADKRVAPYQQQTLADKSLHMLQRAMVTKTPQGAQPDPDVLREVWSRLDPSITSTPQGAAQAFSVALGHSVLLGKTGAKAKEVIPEPLESEKAGGKDVTAATLRDSDKRIARDLGMSDKEYAAEVAQMPAGWGKGQ